MSDPPPVERLAGALRFPLRTAGFVGLTFSLYGMLELDTAISSTEERPAVLYKWIQRYGKGLLALYGVNVTAIGPHVEHGERYPGTTPDGRGRIFIMNHRSGIDIPLTLAFIEATIVSRADLARWPVIGVAARRVGTLFVDRTDKQSGAAVITAMCGAIERGRAVMVYPEGTTFTGDEVRPFRPGAFVAAQRTGAEIVPVGLAYGGEGANFVEEPFAAHMKRVSSASGTRAAMVIGEPLRLPGGASLEETAQAGRDAVQALVHRARAALA
jgi:1-acyl-sn-glycerol-3-phosphate acyltransferase